MRPETFPQILSIGIWAPQEASTHLLQELEESKQHHHHSGWGIYIYDALPLMGVKFEPNQDHLSYAFSMVTSTH